MKYFGSEKYELERYKKIIFDYSEQAIVNIKSLGNMNSMQRIIFSAGLTGSILLGAMKVMDGTLTAGDIVLLQALMMQLFSPLFFLGTMHRAWTESLINIKDLFQILDKKSQIQEKDDAVDFSYKDGSITVHNLGFSYEGRQLFKNLSFEVKGGEWLSVVGPSGVGKSTLFNLIVGACSKYFSSDSWTRKRGASSWTGRT